jgi:hypothetical protein
MKMFWDRSRRFCKGHPSEGKLCGPLFTFLVLLPVSVESQKHYHVLDLINSFVAIVRRGIVGLEKFCMTEIILGFKDISVYSANDQFCTRSRRTNLRG